MKRNVVRLGAPEQTLGFSSYLSVHIGPIMYVSS